MKKIKWPVIGMIFLLVLGGFFYGLVTAQNSVPQNQEISGNPVLNARYASLLPDEKVSVLVYDRCNKSVVNINTLSVRRGEFFLMPVEMEAEEGGSGIVIDTAGHIITNYHVVENAEQVDVTLASGKTYSAKAVGLDPVTDIAVLKIDAPASELVPVAFGDSSQLLVGQNVYAIGNPFGLERTLTTGIISSLNRTINSKVPGRAIKQVIQTDAAINPGNSGGALLNTSGQLIGINTAIATSSGDSAGIGFAIPVNTVARIVPQLIADGKVIRPDIGIIQVQTTERGVLVALLDPDGPAAQAGIIGPSLVVERQWLGTFYRERRYIKQVQSDMITAVNGQPVKTGEDFIGLVEENKPGSTVTLTIIRDNKTLEIPVVLSAPQSRPAF
ncbi:MAG: trypsin-like peptidase domain-containing protein [Planctomycetaceae bacterium]|nr:trypsin-like peptidase domain-containing protein [Planctomycetaceae bacterium]